MKYRHWIKASILGFAVLMSGSAFGQVELAGLEFDTKELAPGVWAVLSNRPFLDNAGFVVGNDGILVIDSHLNKRMAEKIIAAVRRVSDKPIRYLVNTSYHGDHTFGNEAFPISTIVIAHEDAARLMAESFEREKQAFQMILERPDHVADVQLRLPDITYKNRLDIDLGGRRVQLRYFGPAHSPGDTIVFIPGEGITWTGNVVLGRGLVPGFFQGSPSVWIDVVTRMLRELEITTYVPGHGLGGAESLSNQLTIDDALTYAQQLMSNVREMLAAGWEEQAVLNALAIESFPRPARSKAEWAEPLPGTHVQNIKRAIKEVRGKHSPEQSFPSLGADPNQSPM